MRTTEKPANESPKDFYIIGIGTSAGGLEALKDFFNHVPVDNRYAYVIVQHLSPDFKSLMAELLAKNTELPIHEVKNKTKVRGGHIYLIRPRKNMTIEGGILYLTDKPQGHVLNLPIDIFFRSLAKDQKEDAVGVVLSGTGSDGTSGTRAIKEEGGMVLVQDPDEAKFNGMPQSAINTGLVDYVLPVCELPAEIFAYLSTSVHSIEEEISVKSDKHTLDKILRHLQNVTQLDFSEYKLPTITRRLARRLHINRCGSLTSYLDYLYSNPREVQILYREFLIGVTKFFRDPEVWEGFATHALPEIISSKEQGDQLKVWCVGCSTGEEAYTVGIIIDELLKDQAKRLDVKIFASDILKENLVTASNGYYPESIVADVSKKRLQEYFFQKENHYQVADRIKKMIIFSCHNILVDPPFNKMDMVVCRNVLIYLQPTAQKRVMSILHYALNRHGYLVLGPSESVREMEPVLKEKYRKFKIYQNTKVARTLTTHEVANPDLMRPHLNLTNRREKITSDNRMLEVMNDLLCEQFNMAGVYVDAKMDILHAVGEFRKFIQLPNKGFSINLARMLSDHLSMAIHTGLRKCQMTGEKVRYSNLKTSEGSNATVLDVILMPASADATSALPYFLVLFIPKLQQEGKGPDSVPVPSQDAPVRIAELEAELKDSQENLRATIEEVETSNEELQATNEELLASNEELQSTNEELQSVNQELHTVNSEYQEKVNDLALLNADLENYFNSSDIATIFFDREKCIRKFTPSINAQFHLERTDVGRSINDFKSKVKNSSLAEDMAVVLKNGHTIEKEVETVDGLWYLKRISPFIDPQEAIAGVVVNYVDITQIKETQEKLSQTKTQYQKLFDNQLSSIAVHEVVYDTNGKAIDLKFLDGNNKLAEFLQTPKDQFIGKTVSDIIPGFTNNHKALFERYVHIAETGESEEFDLQFDDFNSHYHIKAFSYQRGIVVTIADDITQQHHSLRQLEENRALYASLVDNTVDYIFQVDKDLTIKFINQVIPGLTKDQVLGANLLDLQTDTISKRRAKETITRVFETGIPDTYDIEFETSAGKFFYSSTVSPVKIDNKVKSCTIITRDVSKQKSAEKELEESQKEFRSIFESAAQGMMVSDEEGNIVSVNKSAAKMFGYTANDLKGRKIEELIPKNYRKAHTGHRVKYLKKPTQRTMGEGQELYGLKKSGQTFPIEVALSSFTVGSKRLVTAIVEDITVRKQYQEDLSRTKKMVDGMPIGTIILKREKKSDPRSLRIEYVNPFSINVNGIPPEQVVGKYLWDAFPELDQQMPGLFEIYDKVLKTGESVDLGKMTYNDKEIRHTVFHLSAHALDHQYLYVFHQDITTEHDYQQQILAQSERFKSIFESAAQGILVSSEGGEIVSVNKSAATMFGYTVEGLEGRKIEELIPRDYRKSHTGHRAKYLKKPTQRTMGEGRELYGLKKSGQTFPIEVALSSFVMDGKRLVTAIVEDITVRKGYQEALNRTQKMVDEMPMGIAINRLEDPKDPRSLRLIYVNPYSEQIDGVPPDTIIGKYLKDALPAIGEQVPELFDTYADVIKGQQSVDLGEVVYSDENVAPTVFHITAHPLDEQHLYVLSQNITDRKKNEELLVSQKEALKRSNEQLEQFAYISSHDLQEPLRTIDSFVGLIAKEQAEKLSEKSSLYVEIVQTSVKRITTMISDLLEFSRVGTSGEIGEVALDKVLNEVLSDLKRSVDETHATVETDKLPLVNGKESEYRLLLQNLIINAIKFRKKTVVPVVKIKAREEAHHWAVCVQDNGIGIAKEHQKRIFDIFQRLHTREEYEGTGIGLALCKRIVDSFGGKLYVTSKFQKGATFTFTIPK